MLSPEGEIASDAASDYPPSLAYVDEIDPHLEGCYMKPSALPSAGRPDGADGLASRVQGTGYRADGLASLLPCLLPCLSTFSPR